MNLHPRPLIIVFLMMTSVLFSCMDRSQSNPEVLSEITPEGTFIGGMITYDMLVKNTDPEDDWTEECLSRLDRDRLVSMLFDAVYSKRLVPYDYFSDEELSLSAIRKLENDPEFSRDRIGKVQFREDWYFDEQKLRFHKKVNYLLIAYEVYQSNGELRGHKPAFYVRLN